MKTSPITAVLLVLTVLLFGQVTATPAAAHTALKSSDPKKDEKVETLERVRLEFTQPVKLPSVVLNGPDGRTYHEGEPELDGAVVVQDVADALPPGKYTIGYRVVSADGHPVTGEIPFTVVAPDSPSPTPEESAAEAAATPDAAAQPTAGPPAGEQPAGEQPPATPAAAAEDAAADEDAGVPAWVWIVVFGLAGVGIGMAFSMRKKP